MLYAYSNFLDNYSSGDVTLKIRNIKNELVYEILPHSILFSGVNGKQINIKTTLNKPIVLPFSSDTESRDSLIKLQSLIDYFIINNPQI
jgi:hypothetical protein